MSHKNKQCLRMQAKDVYVSKTCLGRSKHDDKYLAGRNYDRLPDDQRTMSKQDYINNAIRDRIYSSGTYATYEKQSSAFLNYCEHEHGCKTLDQCREHADEWLQRCMDAGQSAYTVATRKAALCKLYGESGDNFIRTPDRHRSEITRSRNDVDNDKHFSEDRNRELVNFCKGTGLRRSEIEHLRGSQLRQDDSGNYVIEVKGKGGKIRDVPIIGDHKDDIVHRMQSAGDNRVWDHVSRHMDVHGYRSDYATAIYNAHARDPIPREDQYHCRGDLAGRTYDKAAMLEASKALGHNRIDVVAGHYLR